MPPLPRDDMERLLLCFGQSIREHDILIMELGNKIRRTVLTIGVSKHFCAFLFNTALHTNLTN